MNELTTLAKIVSSRRLRGLADIGFEPVKARKKGLATLETLTSMPLPGDAFGEIEIIPYEHL